MMAENISGILIIDKPGGFTSFDVIAVLRGVLKTRKIGHSGTLDPMATGALPIFIEKATKAIDLLPNHDKEYEAAFKLGVTTTTGDSTGELLTKTQSSASEEDVNKALKSLTGKIKQVPPMYSAVKKDGVRLYDLARQGITVERASKTITVYKNILEFFDEKNQTGTLTVGCSKGTYIRTIIEDLGGILKTGAVMTSLRRTKACSYGLNGSVTVDGARSMGRDALIAKIQPIDSAFPDYESVYLDNVQSNRFLNGAGLDMNRLEKIPQANIFKVYASDSKFLGLGKKDRSTNELRVLKLL